MQSISKWNKGARFLLCVIDIFNEYAWVVPLKDKKRVTIVRAFQKISDNSMTSKAQFKGRKPIKYGQTKQVNFTIVLLKND